MSENTYCGVFTHSNVIQERENSVNFLKRQHLSCFHFRTLIQRLLLTETEKRKFVGNIMKILYFVKTAYLQRLTKISSNKLDPNKIIKIQYISSMFTIHVYVW